MGKLYFLDLQINWRTAPSQEQSTHRGEEGPGLSLNELPLHQGKQTSATRLRPLILYLILP